MRVWIVLWQYKDENGNTLSVESKPLVYDWETAENSNSAFVHFRDMGNEVYRVEVDVYDVFGGTDGIDPYQDYDDMVFLIGPRPNLESFLGFALQ